MVLFHLLLLMMFKPHLLGRPFFHCIEFQHRQTKFVIYLCSQIAVFVHVPKLWFSFFPLSQNELVNFSPLHLGDLCKKMEAEWVNQCWEFPVAGVCLVRWGFKWRFYNNDCFFFFPSLCCRRPELQCFGWIWEYVHFETFGVSCG